MPAEGMRLGSPISVRKLRTASRLEAKRAPGRVAAVGRHGRTASVAGSEAGGGVRKEVRLPRASRTIAAGTTEGGRRSFAWARA